MIKFVQGDIFQSKAQTLIATVNCVGIMGKGLAKEFRLRYPEMYREYVKICKKGELRKGRLFHFKDLHSSILCFPTKDNWKGPSKYEFVEEGLEALVVNYEKWQISSLAIPPLGCGLGGLDWDKVKSLIKKYLSHLPIEIEVYEPLVGAERIPSRNPFRKRGRIKLSPSLVYTGEIIRIARKAFPADMPIGRLLLQKIAFFAQMAGLPIKLEFTEFEFGPYDRTLKYNVDRLEGLFIRDASPSLGKSDLRMLDEEEWEAAIGSLKLDLKDVRGRIQVAVDYLRDLSLQEIELLATVLLVWASLTANGAVASSDEVIEYIGKWKPGRFKTEQIEFAFQKLQGEWIHSQVSNHTPDEASQLICL